MNLTDALDPADSEQVGAVAAALAGMERDLHEAIQDHYDALGVDPPADRDAPEERIAQLRRLVDHHLREDLWGYFVAEQAPEGLENPEEAERYAGMDRKAWNDTVEEWVEAAGAAPEADESAPDRVVRERFGLDRATFERRVVEWTPERTLRIALRGPMDADIERLRVATSALRRKRDGEEGGG
ncbi:hypothetical protein [Natronomonas amylolytica]|uniref:hypothetical protein n=1 Tax=Natronomonas amylolytica TaxID=3108498 RepID=UPI003009DDEC